MCLQQRARHLETWLRELGRDRARDSITAAEIDEVLQRWLTTPTNQPPSAADHRKSPQPLDTRPPRYRGRPSAPTGLAPATVIKRRMALLSFFRTMNGKDGENPVRATKRPHPPKAEARGLDYTTIARILAAMPASDTKKRVDVLAYTGLPPGLLATVTRFDLDLSKKTVRVRPRRKGAGVAAATLPLTSEGLRAFRAFHRADLYGIYSVTAANRSFKRACAALELRGLTVYDLRHSFLTQMFLITKDTSTTARFGLHASLATTQRYVQAAMRQVDTEAAAAAGRVFAEGRKLSRKAVPIRQRRRAQ